MRAPTPNELYETDFYAWTRQQALELRRFARMERKLSPTIRHQLRRDLRPVHTSGRQLVERKMRRHGEDRAAAALPPDCPYTMERVLGDWLPQI